MNELFWKKTKWKFQHAKKEWQLLEIYSKGEYFVGDLIFTGELGKVVKF